MSRSHGTTEHEFRWTDEQVGRALGLPPRGEASYPQISTDTRELAPGALFVALRGERFDAHDFIGDALARGAAGLVVDRPPDDAGDAAVYRVPDTLEALGRLARHRRRSLGWTVVGVTGSAGKTTAKDLLRAALSASLDVHATRGNRNNRVGVPLTLLEAPARCDVVVVEMGTNEPGEIGILTGIAEPDLAVLTTVGEAHLEGLSSREGIYREKLALLAGLGSGGWAVVGDEPPDLPERARAVFPRVAVAGLSEAADPALRGEALEAAGEGRFRFRRQGLTMELRIPGVAAVRNALLALAVADRLRVPPEGAAEAVVGVPPPPLRGEVRRIGELTVIVDCYNANPQSVRSALETLEAMPAPGGRVAVLGSMLELGSHSRDLHERILEGLGGRPFRFVLLVGEEFEEAFRRWEEGRRAETPRTRWVASTEKAFPVLRSELHGREILLLKGSRGLALEALLPLLEEAHGRGPPRRAPGEV